MLVKAYQVTRIMVLTVLRSATAYFNPERGMIL